MVGGRHVAKWSWCLDGLGRGKGLGRGGCRLSRGYSGLGGLGRGVGGQLLGGRWLSVAMDLVVGGCHVTLFL